MELTAMLVSVGGIGYPLGVGECSSHGDASYWIEACTR